MKSLLSVTAALALTVSIAHASSFSEMVNFGDSLSDTGNIFDLTTSLSPLVDIAPGSPGYYNGRFSNGPIWIDQFATLMSLPAPSPSRLGGTDYAYGLAHSGSGNTQVLIPNIQTQIGDWTTNHTSTSDQLFTVLGGAMDLLDTLDNNDPAATQTANATQAAHNIAAGLQSLYNDGARNILVANLPDLGLVPRYHNTASQSQATADTNTFNTTLAADLATLDAASPGLNLYLLDLQSLFADAIANPAAYGLTNITDPAYTGDPDYLGSGTAVANPAGYLFWDSVHPTTTGHSMLAQAAYAAVPEPAATLLFILPAATMLLRRRYSTSPDTTGPT